MQLDVYLSAFEAILNQYLFNSQKASNFNKVQSIAKTLTNFSKKTGFLDAAFYLLMHYEHETEKTLLIVTLMKDKFKYDFQNIEYFQISNYYDRLCELASQLKYSNRPIFKQICMCLAYIYLNLSSVQNIPLIQYLAPFTPKHNPPTDDQSLLYNYYFKLLQYIAIEVDNSKLVLDDDSREYSRRQIIEHQQNILSLLNQSASQLWNNRLIHKNNVFGCFASWVQLKYKRQILNSLPEHGLMPFLFQHALDYYNVDTAVQCLKAIINMIRGPQENGPLIQYLGFNIVQLVEPAEKYIRHKQIEDAETYIDLILQFSTKAIYIFTSTNTQVLDFMHKLVKFTKNKSFKIYQDFIDFWEEYIKQVQKINNNYIDPQIEYLLQELYDAICSQCRFPNQIISRLEDHQQKIVLNQNSTASQISERRQYTQQLLELMAHFLGLQNYIRFICNKIIKLNPKSQLFWSYFEIYIFSLVNPLKKINFINQDLYLLVNTFNQLNTQPENNTPIAIKRIFLRLFRALLNNSQKDKILVQKIFFYSSTCFGVELLACQADKTFCRGCELNGNLMIKDLPDFIQMMRSFTDRQNIVLGVFYIICSTQQTIQQYLLNTLLIITDSINALPNCAKRKDIMNTLIDVTKLIKECKLIQNNLNIIKQFIRMIFPLIKDSLSDAQSTRQDQNAEIERIVKILKYLMRCLGLQFWEFTPQICECVINCYRVQPVCSYLYLIEILITIFSKDANYEQFILNLYCYICEYTSKHFSNIDNIEKYNFLLDDFIGMNKRLFIYNAAIVLKSNQLGSLVSKCLDYVGCKIPRIAKAAYTFFQTIFMAYWRPQFIQKYNLQAQKDSLTKFNPKDSILYEQLRGQLQDKIHYVVASMLQHLSQNPVQMVYFCIFDAIIAELKAFPQWNRQLWPNLINPLPNDIFRQKQKQDFLTYVNQTSSQDFELVQRSIQSLQKMLTLMSKRLTTSTKRKDNYT